jgi:hypothetical protein
MDCTVYDNCDIIWYNLLLYVLMKFHYKVPEDGECTAIQELSNIKNT